MREFLFGLAELGLTMGAVIALLLALGPAVSRKFRPQWRYWAWLLVALRLAVPFNVSLPAPPVVLEAPLWTAPAVERVERPETVPAEGELPAVSGPQSATLPAAPVEPSGSTVAGAPPVPAPETVPVAERALPPLAVVLFALWGAGALLFLAVQMGGYLQFLRRVRRWRSPAGYYEGLPVYRCAVVPAPVLAGLVRPRVYLPEGLRGEPCAFALLHEHAHAIRRDLWYKALLVWVNALFWFHPLVWLLRRSAERDIEIACDAQVLRERDQAYRQRYGAALLSFAAGVGRGAPLTSSFAGGMPGLRLRFRALVDTAPKRAGRAALALVLCAALLGAGVVACRTAEDERPEDGIYYSRDPALEGDVLTFTPLTGDGTADTALSFPLAEHVRLPGQPQNGRERDTSVEGVTWLLNQRDIDTAALWPGYLRQRGEVDALMVTVTGGEITAAKWVADPHLDGGDGFYYGDYPTIADGSITFEVLPVTPSNGSVSIVAEERRQVSFPLADVVEARSAQLDPLVPEDLEILLHGPMDSEDLDILAKYWGNYIGVGQMQTTRYTVKDGKVCAIEWIPLLTEPPALEDGIYYGIVDHRSMEEETFSGLQIYLSRTPPQDRRDLMSFGLCYVPVAPAQREGLLKLLLEPLCNWERSDDRLLQLTIKDGEAVELDWAGEQYDEIIDLEGGIVFILPGGAVHEIDLEKKTITLMFSPGNEENEHVLDTYNLAPDVLVQMWDENIEHWTDASMDELTQKVNLTSTWGVPCEIRIAGHWVTAIREEAPWGRACVQDGVYSLGRVRWGDTYWDTPEKPIGAVEATIYELDPETGHVVDSDPDIQLMVSKHVVCYNEDGTVWEGDLASFLEDYDQAARALRQERKNFLTWPLNNILVLEAEYEAGLIRTLRRMPPPEL